MFDWARFLARHNITFVSRGPNIGRSEIAVRCPWCGSADASQHLAISLRGRGYVCRRNRSHGGKSIARLIGALLGCSPEHAAQLAGVPLAPPLPPDENLSQRIAGLLGLQAKAIPAPPPTLKLPREFKPLDKAGVLGEVAWEYLADRGFPPQPAQWLVTTYNLHWASSGPYRYRIIVPVTDTRGTLMTWTARSVVNDVTRYKTLSSDSDDPAAPVALRSPKELLLGLPFLWSVEKPKALVLTEGPFDAFKISVAGIGRGVVATCLFGLDITLPQVALVEELSTRFDKLWLLLDPDASLRMLKIRDALGRLKVERATLPKGVKDPGDLDWSEAGNLVRQLT